MNTAEILEAIEVNYSECLLADGLEDAIVGVIEGAGRDTVICYDYELCVAVLVGQGMEEEDAREFLDFNTVGAYVGEKTPMFLHDWRKEETDGPGVKLQATVPGRGGDGAKLLQRRPAVYWPTRVHPNGPGRRRRRPAGRSR